jgi:transposase-like protein
MAIYPDGTRELLHDEIAQSESHRAWEAFFQHLQERGLNLDEVQVVVSDGTNGLPAVLKTWGPQAQHQLCITHKVRAMLRHLAYKNLSTQDPQGQTLSPTQAKKLGSSQIQTDAYDIYKTDEIGAFPNEDSCLTLFFLVIQRDHAKHDRLKSVAKT